LHDLRYHGQGGVTGPGVVAGRVQDGLPQGELADPERLEEIRQRDALGDPPGRLLPGEREVGAPGWLAGAQRGQEGQEDGPHVGGDVGPQLVVVAAAVGGYLGPDGFGRRLDDLLQRRPDRHGDPLRAGTGGPVLGGTGRLHATRMPGLWAGHNPRAPVHDRYKPLSPGEKAVGGVLARGYARR